MQPSSEGFPESSHTEDGDEHDYDNTADGKDNGRPYQMKGSVKIVVDQKLYAHTENRKLHKEIQRGGNKGNRKTAVEQGENLNQNGKQGNDGKRQPEKPAVVCGVKGNHIKVHTDGNAVKQKRNVDGKSGNEKCRKKQYQQNQTGTDDV